MSDTLRLDSDKPESHHCVTERRKCYEMSQKYNWKLLRIERTGDKTLKYDCVFEGKTEFPNYLED
ncbi:MAG: hypothetical protein F6J86_27285 [Symploca sp. SIO1B1]|nr:hypothetical protein [Symploca sp. SIO1A3]NER97510.1 hypothetical protein [Symploca sp. SIO1B1]